MTLHSFVQITTRKRALCVVLVLFMLSILIRLPNLNRAVSKHYEFNTAVVMINIISWRQAGGGDKFHYTPVMNFQHPGDKLPPNNLFVDKNGNTVYLSYGPGWYVIPYFFYQLLNLPAVPIYLEILNLVFHVISVSLFFFLLEQLIPSGEPRRYSIIMAGCIFMTFSPGILWFLGNGYINIGIMLPFDIGVFLLVLPMLNDSAKISASRLVPLGILNVVLIYIDWYILFFSLLTSIVALFKFRLDKKYGWLLFVLILSVASGIVLVFIQFASYMGQEAVAGYWFHRFSDRGLNLAGSSFTKKLSYLLAYFLTSYLPLIILLLISFLNGWRRKILPVWSDSEILFLRLFTASLLFYNFLLFDWSTDHEFAILPWSILISFIAARLIGSLTNKMAYRMMGFFIILAVAQYYYINRPGPIARDGLPYDRFKKLGESLSHIPPDYSICINLEQNPMVEYYAGRNILRAADSLSFIHQMDRYTRCIRADQGSRIAEFFHFAENTQFDIQPFHHYFNNPIAGGNIFHVISEIARLDSFHNH